MDSASASCHHHVPMGRTSDSAARAHLLVADDAQPGHGSAASVLHSPGKLSSPSPRRHAPDRRSGYRIAEAPAVPKRLIFTPNLRPATLVTYSRSSFPAAFTVK